MSANTQKMRDFIRDLRGDGDVAGEAADPRPKVYVPSDMTPIGDSAAAVGQMLGNAGRHYLRGGAVVKLLRDECHNASLAPLHPAALASDIELVARPVSLKASKQGTPTERPAIFKEPAAKLVFHADRFREELPVIRLVSRCPVLVERKEGHLEVVTGFDRESGVLADGEKPDEVPLFQAVSLLSDALSDFAFTTPSDRSRALAALVTPAIVMAALLGMRAPVDLGEADKSQTGKGYRNKITAAVYRTTVETISQKRGGVGSLEEDFDDKLVRGANFICLDNVRGKIDSQKIEMFLTEDRYTARVPFQRGMAIDPRRFIVMMTSNSAEITTDLANRCYCIRIRKQDENYIFRRYKGNRDILGHVRANQRQYLGAVFAIVRAWHKAGMPATEERRHDRRDWAGALDWIVQNIFKAAPLLDGHREAQGRMTSPSLNWLRGVAIMVRGANMFGRELRPHDLLRLLEEQDEISIPGLAKGDDISSELVRANVFRAIGRVLRSCFNNNNNNNTVNIEDMVVRRVDVHDDFNRKEARAYVFNAGGGAMGADHPTPAGRAA